jgi:hypothetical protein
LLLVLCGENDNGADCYEYFQYKTSNAHMFRRPAQTLVVFETSAKGVLNHEPTMPACNIHGPLPTNMGPSLNRMPNGVTIIPQDLTLERHC